MNFYKDLFGGELTITTYGEAQGAGCPAGAKERIIHAALKRGDFLLLASDTPDSPPAIGNNIQLSLSCDSLEQIELFFEKLSDKGSANLPLHDAFWGARFGMLTDRYGFLWMLSFEKKKT